MYYETLAEELLRISDCAVFYYAPDEDIVPDEEYRMSLEQMQLFVVPVTNRFLLQPSRATDTELPFALEHHVPVLPIVCEPGLEQPLQERFGDMEFLNRVKQDDTAIPYREKLKSFVQSVLAGDELAAQIRASFDAYIFLSYRKKDRRYGPAADAADT